MSTIHNSQIFRGISVLGKVTKGLTKNGNIFYFYLTSETVNIINYATLNGYTLPSEIYIQKLDSHIRDLKAFGLFNKLDLAYWMVGDSDMNFKTINIIDPTKFKGSLVGGLINTNQGIEGNGVNAYIDTNFNHLLDSVKQSANNASRVTYLYKVSSGNTVIVSGDYSNLFSARNGYSAQRINTTGGNTIPSAEFYGIGFKAFNRISDVDLVSINGVVSTALTSTTTSTALRDENHTLLSRLDLNRFSLNGMSAYGLGSQIIGADAINYRTAILNNL